MERENGTIWLVTDRSGREALFYSAGRPVEWKRFNDANQLVKDGARPGISWTPLLVALGLAIATGALLILVLSGRLGG